MKSLAAQGKETACKSAGYAFGGSNPPSSTKEENSPKSGGFSSMLELFWTIRA